MQSLDYISKPQALSYELHNQTPTLLERENIR